MSDTFEIVETIVSDEAVRRMTADQIATYAILSAVFSENVVLQKFLLLGPKEPVDPEILNRMYASQIFFIIRYLASKNLEVLKTLMHEGNENKTKDEKLESFRLKAVKPRQQALFKKHNAKWARMIRNKFAFHCDLSRWREAINLEGLELEHSIISVDPEGGVFLDFGEIVQLAGLQEENSKAHSLEEIKAKIEELSKFTRDAIEVTRDIFFDFLKEFDLHINPEKRHRTKIPEAFQYSPGSAFPLVQRVKPVG